MYYSQSPRLEKLGRNRYMATVFSLVPEKASEFILTKRQAKRAFPELMASLETFSKLNNA